MTNGFPQRRQSRWEHPNLPLGSPVTREAFWLAGESDFAGKSSKP